MGDSDCVFCKIAAGSIPAKVMYQDDATMAFEDISPAAPVHIVVISKDHIPTANEITDGRGAIAGRLVAAATRVAKDLGIDASGYRIVINCNRDGGQAVKHLHAHLLGGRALAWPPG